MSLGLTLIIVPCCFVARGFGGYGYGFGHGGV